MASVSRQPQPSLQDEIKRISMACWKLGRYHIIFGWVMCLCPAIWAVVMYHALHQPQLDTYTKLVNAARLSWGFVIPLGQFRAAACSWDDITDYAIDGLVERTKGRPLPSGQISYWGAVTFFLFQVATTIAMFRYYFPYEVQIVAVFAWFLALVYPNLKYYTYWPQAWLGLLCHVFIPAAWIACINFYEPNTGNPYVHVLEILKRDWMHILPIWLGGACFTITYDTAYGYQDIRDDSKLGLHSTSILFGMKFGKTILTAFFVAFLAVLYATTYITKMSALLLTAFPAIYIGPYLLNVKLSEPKSCGKLVWQCIKAEMWMTVAFSADLFWRSAFIRA